ncbi:MAG: methyltransferase [Hyphomicrobiaceae bacterium]|nr:methyltransferase [Hyphomicrobiaceae bacterium]
MAVSENAPTGSSEKEGGGSTRDAFLDGRLAAVQPAAGHHRSGSDALFLAGCVTGPGVCVDLGAGVGVAGLAAACRIPGLEVLLVERDAVMLDHARRTLESNPALSGRARLIGLDVTAPEAERQAAGLGRAFADWVIINPPYRLAGSVRATPHAARAEAHLIAGVEALDPWLRTAAAVLKPGGRLRMILDAACFPEILPLLEGRFGAVTLRGLHPRAGLAAERLLLGAIKGRKTPPRLLEGLVLHETDGRYTGQAGAILEGRAAIAMEA